MAKELVLFINLREYDQGVNEDGSPALGSLTDNFYCIRPENAEMTGDMMFLGYIEENGERVGVRLVCDPGYINDSGEPLVVNLKIGGKYRFAHTDRSDKGPAVSRIRGYNLRLYESDGHEHRHDHDHEHEHGHDECADCGKTDCSECSERADRDVH